MTKLHVLLDSILEKYDSSILVEGSNLMRGLFTGNVDSLLSRDVMLLELLSPSGDFIVFS